MFIGHYGPALAVKGFAKSVPLWVLFVAAQWVDFLWAALVIMGIEKVRIIANFFGLSPLDLYYMPYQPRFAERRAAVAFDRRPRRGGPAWQSRRRSWSRLPRPRSATGSAISSCTGPICRSSSTR